MRCWHDGRRLELLRIAAMTTMIVFGIAANAFADHPPRASVAKMPPVRTIYAPCDREDESPIEAAPVRPYSYGFFGGKGGPQAHRHFGYYNNYRQWTFR